MMPEERILSRIGITLVVAALMGGIIVGSGALFRVKDVPKGWKAPYTMRAPSELVWNQAEVRAFDVRGFVPIYDAQPAMLEARRGEILSEVSQLQPSFWRLPDEEREDSTYDWAPSLLEVRHAERAAQASSLTERLFDVIEPYYQDGVIADGEFPAQEPEVRIFESDDPEPAGQPTVAPAAGAALAAKPVTTRALGGRYQRVSVARLHRFNDLRTVAERALERDFPGVEPLVRDKVVRYVFDRLPPSLHYSRTNADHVADRSLVTGQRAVLVRGGEVLVRRHQVIDTRAEDALRAALDAQPARRGAWVATFGLLVVVTLLGSRAMAVASPELAVARTQAAVFGAFALLIAFGKLTLALTALSETMVPLAAVPAAVAVLCSVRAGAVTAVLAAAYAALGFVFDVTTFAVTVAGGLTLVLFRRPGTLRHALAAGGAAALVQGTLFAACVLLGARPHSTESAFAGVQALVSGLCAGVLGLSAAQVLTVWRKVRAAARTALDPASPRATIPTP
jgi:hypothetical protein